MPEVSVIVPIYNVEPYLRQCIDSILNQTFTDFECILVDDGSPDNCPQICDEYAETDSRIKVIHKKNGGLSDARNAGLDIATGKYIYFVDSDDYLKEDLLERILNIFNDTNADMVSFDYCSVDKQGEIISTANFNHGEYKISSENDYVELLANTVLPYRVGFEVWDRIYKRSIIEKEHLRFYDNKKIYAEDVYFLLCYLLSVKKLIVVNDVLYYHLVREDSIVGSNTETKVNEYVNLSYQVFRYIKKRNYKHILKNYYIIFYHLMTNRFVNQTLEIRMAELLKADNKKFARKNVLIALLNINKIKNDIDCVPKKELYLIHICYFLSTFDGVFGKALRFIFRTLLNTLHFIKALPDKLWRKNIYLFGTEDFGNIGDHLIAITEIKFLKEHFPKHNIIELTASEYGKYIIELSKRIKKRDVIFLTGGGNMGDMYPFANRIRNNVISRFKKNKIIIFPQTMFFTNIEENLQSIAKPYTSANNLVIALREKYSYELCSKVFGDTKLLLVPDIVLYNNLQKECKRDNIIRLCVRSDIEGLMTEEDHESLKNYINSLNKSVEVFDMQFEKDINVNDRLSYIDKILEKYHTAQAIITDRLHGMIVSAVTGTPCVAIESKSYKMKGTYEFIKDLDYIKLVGSVDDVPSALGEVLSINTDKIKYSNKQFLHYYEQIIDEVIGNAKN